MTSQSRIAKFHEVLINSLLDPRGYIFGGKGSGHFKHAGIPGHQGGSLPSADRLFPPPEEIGLKPKSQSKPAKETPYVRGEYLGQDVGQSQDHEIVLLGRTSDGRATDSEQNAILDTVAKLTGKELPLEQESWTALAELGGAFADEKVFIREGFAGQSIRTIVQGKSPLGTEYTIETTLQESPEFEGEPEIHIDWVVSSPADNPDNIGLRAVAQIISQCEKFDIHSITLEAARSSFMVGYYVWPRLGFDAELSYEEDIAPMPLTLRKYIEEVAEQNFKGFEAQRYMLSTLMANPDSRSWWKKNGHGVEATFDVWKGSLSRIVFGEYMKEKGL